jgi:hypothetical protein
MMENPHEARWGNEFAFWMLPFRITEAPAGGRFPRVLPCGESRIKEEESILPASIQLIPQRPYLRTFLELMYSLTIALNVIQCISFSDLWIKFDILIKSYRSIDDRL